MSQLSSTASHPGGAHLDAVDQITQREQCGIREASPRAEALADGTETVTGSPVPPFPIQFKWQTGDLLKLFDRQVRLITEDIARARSADRLVVYISCPISSRGGGFAGTNVEIALHTQNRLQRTWGERFWSLNPAQYQMESRVGTGLILRHARDLILEGEIEPKAGYTPEEQAAELVQSLHTSGGDYMRMWTRVLVEDQPADNAVVVTGSDGKIGEVIPDAHNMGGRFSAFYFVAPSDAEDFFRAGGASTLTAGVESYFARQYAMDPIFRRYFTPDGPDAEELWHKLRLDFFGYYANHYSVNYSLGSHDEWNILVELNKIRIVTPQLGIGYQIAGYYDGLQIAPASSVTRVTPGYAVPT